MASAHKKMIALDLFCGAGGAAVGMWQTNLFDQIVGVDIEPHDDYPFDLVEGDALEFDIASVNPDFIWASPPCQYYSYITIWRREQRDKLSKYPDLVPAVSELLEGYPFTCIENVPGSPLRPDIVLQGGNVGLPNLHRRRYFQTSWTTLSPKPYTDGEVLCQIYGNGGPRSKRVTERRHALGMPATWTLEDAKHYGIDWTEDRKAITQMVFPAYSKYIIEDAVRHGFGSKRSSRKAGTFETMTSEVWTCRHCFTVTVPCTGDPYDPNDPGQTWHDCCPKCCRCGCETHEKE